MKKYLILFVLPLAALAFSGCNDDDDVMDTKLIRGQWENVTESSPEYKCIYDFKTQSENTWSWGEAVVYYLTVSGTQVYDRVYDWHVSDPENYETVYLDLTLKGLLNGDDAWENTEQYIVEKLSASEMVLRPVGSADPESRVRFIRRSDLAGR